MRLTNLLRGFTLVELAIVIVIAGILAAVAIPIYQGLINDSKWSEGKSAAGTVRQSADVYKARQSGNFTGLTAGAMDNAVTVGQLKLTNAFDNLRYFVPGNIVLAVPVVTAGNYTVTVSANAVAVTDAPINGPYVINQGGDETGP